MKRKIVLFTFSFLLVFAGCKYEDFVVDYNFTAVYFPHDVIDRTVIVGEYMNIGVGVSLGGRIENTRQEWASYQIDQQLLEGTSYLPLPESYFTVDDPNQIIIPKGKFMGLLNVTINPELFLTDSLALSSDYALAFRLLDTSVDSVLEGRESTIISFKYINTFEGNYYHNGMAVGYSGSTAVDTIFYPTDDLWELKTFSPNGVTAPEMANFSGDEFLMNLVVSSENTVTISRNPSGIEVYGNGSYDPETRTFVLEYNFNLNELNYTVRDTLSFRNRIVDGINQWNL